MGELALQLSNVVATKPMCDLLVKRQDTVTKLKLRFGQCAFRFAADYPVNNEALKLLESTYRGIDVVVEGRRILDRLGSQVGNRNAGAEQPLAEGYHAPADSASLEDSAFILIGHRLS